MEKELKEAGGLVGGIMAFAVVLQLAFWLLLIAGALWLCKHFGVF